MQSIKNLSKSFVMAITLFAGLGIFITSCGDDEVLPKASFTSEATELVVAFTSTSTDATSYSWDFGDGNTSTDENPSNTYAAAGTYTVKLTATNDDGSNTAEEEVTVEGGAVSNNINLTWETESGDAAVDAFFDGFGEYSTERIANPDMNGNTSGFVMKLTRGEGCEPWGGVGQGLDNRVDFSTQPTTITLDVWGEATDVTLVLENNAFPDTDPKFTKTVNMTKSNEWETLTFDFSGGVAGETYGNLILYITRDQAGCNNEVYYVDNIIQG